MRFEAPWFALLVPLLVAIWALARRRSVRIAFPAYAVAREVAPSWRRRLAALPAALLLLALVLLALALTGPQHGSQARRPEGDGIDIELVLDISSSMKQTDLSATHSRLAVATQVLDTFIAERPADRIGLLTFAMYPRAASPLTHDHDSLRRVLAEVRPVVPGAHDDGTSIGLAIAAAVMHLQDSPAPSRVVVLLTDGRETRDPVGQMEAADLARACGVKLYTIAAGHRVGRWGEDLKVVAERTGGRGFVARDALVLASIYRDIDALERHSRIAPSITTWADLYPGLIALALALLLLALPIELFYLRRAS